MGFYPRDREITSAFWGISKTPCEVFEATMGRLGYCYRPSGSENGFRGCRLALDRFSLMTCRPQWGLHRQKLVPRVIIGVHQFQYNRFSGRIVLDATIEESTAAACWDVAVPRGVSAGGQNVLDHKRNVTAARAAIALHRAVTHDPRYDHPLATEPVWPLFYGVFVEGDGPVMERTPNLLAAVRASRPELAGAPDEAIPDELCHEVFAAALVREGNRILTPNWLFSRDPWHRYAVHPRSGTSRPTIAGKEGVKVADWVMIDGTWQPLAQQPREVIADLSPVLGRESFAAWEILVDIGRLAPMRHADWSRDCPHEEWERFREEVLTALFPDGEADNPLVAEWRRRNAFSTRMLTDEDAFAAFSDVRWPVTFPDESRVGAVALQGYPSPENLWWEACGLAVDLFHTRFDWAWRADPVTPQEVERLRRGFQVRARRQRRMPQVLGGSVKT